MLMKNGDRPWPSSTTISTKSGFINELVILINTYTSPHNWSNDGFLSSFSMFPPYSQGFPFSSIYKYWRNIFLCPLNSFLAWHVLICPVNTSFGKNMDILFNNNSLCYVELHQNSPTSTKYVFISLRCKFPWGFNITPRK